MPTIKEICEALDDLEDCFNKEAEEQDDIAEADESNDTYKKMDEFVKKLKQK